MLDVWSRWLLEDRFGGDRRAMATMLESLGPIRDRVLAGARLLSGDRLLDVGTGDGLIGFAALSRVGPDGTVVFSDVSADLLEACRDIATTMGVTDRCEFVEADAQDLQPIGDDTVDVVTTRSVLIYVDDKEAAFRQFRRVLRPEGRLSLFEPINSTMRQLNAGSLHGYDARAIPDLVEKLAAVFEEAVGGDDAAMLGFEATDLVTTAERAGFGQLQAQVRIAEQDRAHLGPSTWSTLMRSRPNPLAPTVGEAIERALTPDESARLREHLEPQVITGSGHYFTVGCFLQGQAPG